MDTEPKRTINAKRFEFLYDELMAGTVLYANGQMARNLEIDLNCITFAITSFGQEVRIKLINENINSGVLINNHTLGLSYLNESLKLTLFHLNPAPWNE